MSQSEESYKTEALYMTEDTKVQEVLDFLQDVVENPIILGEDDNETVVWNFSTHKFQEMAAPDNIVDKDCDKFIVPYQVTGVWGFMFSLLPEEVRRSELLIYREEKYFAFRNFYRTTTSERQRQIQNDLARRLEQTDVPGVME